MVPGRDSRIHRPRIPHFASARRSNGDKARFLRDGRGAVRLTPYLPGEVDVPYPPPDDPWMTTGGLSRIASNRFVTITWGAYSHSSYWSPSWCIGSYVDILAFQPRHRCWHRSKRVLQCYKRAIHRPLVQWNSNLGLNSRENSSYTSPGIRIAGSATLQLVQDAGVCPRCVNPKNAHRL